MSRKFTVVPTAVTVCVVVADVFVFAGMYGMSVQAEPSRLAWYLNVTVGVAPAASTTNWRAIWAFV